MRDLPMPGLAELHEAISDRALPRRAAPLRLIRDRLEIGDGMGAVPHGHARRAAAARPRRAQQTRLRSSRSAEIKLLDLDLRNETDRARSQLCCIACSLLASPGASPQRSAAASRHLPRALAAPLASRSSPSRLIEANIWGNTVEAAATRRAPQGRRGRRPGRAHCICSRRRSWLDSPGGRRPSARRVQASGGRRRRRQRS